MIIYSQTYLIYKRLTSKNKWQYMLLSGFDRNVNNCIYVNGLNTHCEADLFFTFQSWSIDRSIDRSRERERERERWIWSILPYEGPLFQIRIEVFYLILFKAQSKYISLWKHIRRVSTLLKQCWFLLCLLVNKSDFCCVYWFIKVIFVVVIGL